MSGTFSATSAHATSTRRHDGRFMSNDRGRLRVCNQNRSSKSHGRRAVSRRSSMDAPATHEGEAVKAKQGKHERKGKASAVVQVNTQVKERLGAALQETLSCWEHVGVPADERARELEELQGKLLSALDTFSHKAVAARDVLLDDVSREQLLISQVTSSGLGLEPLPPDLQKRNLQQQVAVLKEYRQTAVSEHRKAREEIASLHAKLHSAWAEAGVADNDRPQQLAPSQADLGVLSKERFDMYRAHLESAEKQINDMLEEGEKLEQEDSELLNELGADASAVENHKKLVELFNRQKQHVNTKEAAQDNGPVSLHELHHQLVESHAALCKQTEENRAKKQMLAEQLRRLVDELGEDVTEYAPLLAIAGRGALSPKVIAECEQLHADLHKRHQTEYCKLVSQARCYMSTLKLHMDPAQRLKYDHLIGQVDQDSPIPNLGGESDAFVKRVTEMGELVGNVVASGAAGTSLPSLREIVAATKELEKLLAECQKILVMIERREWFKSEMRSFEAVAGDPSRLFGESSQLLREEAFRKLVAREYPPLMEGLVAGLKRWELVHGYHLYYDGVPYLLAMETEQNMPSFDLLKLKLLTKEPRVPRVTQTDHDPPPLVLKHTTSLTRPITVQPFQFATSTESSRSRSRSPTPTPHGDRPRTPSPGPNARAASPARSPRGTPPGARSPRASPPADGGRTSPADSDRTSATATASRVRVRAVSMPPLQDPAL
eukprot:TRINITY_DN759_c0_g1_i1.p1 TRINITY_DN759_c0_g1~~TRINITY_DN759_c0_g1_i1.p1  ORF type:complete len:720 (+),score=149.30 TRINITY_DN759_c0_g1_i1:1228-3387(+)